MQNKIILELPDKTEATIDNVDFIKIEGSDNTIRIKVKSVENFKALKGLLIAGNPVQIVKRNINWDFRNIQNYELYRKGQLQ